MTDSKEDGLTISVEREDLEDGSITYHLWDTTNGDYKWIVGLNDDKAAQGGKSKFYAERIALAVNALSASSPPVGGSGEVVTESTRLAAEQILVLHPHLPPLAAHLIKRVSQLPTALAAPVPNGVPEGWVPTADVSIIPSDNNTYLRLVVQPQHGERAEYRVSVGAVDVLFHELAGMADVAASPVTPEGLSGGDEIALIEAAASVMAKRRGLTYVSDPVKRERYREFLLAATNTV